MSARLMFRLCVSFCVTLVLLLTGGDGFAQPRPARSFSSKLDAHLRQSLARDGDASERRVIVRVDPKAAKAVDALLRSRGDRMLRYHPTIGAFSLRAKNLLALAESGDVKSISIDAPLQAHQVVFTPLVTQDVVRRTLGVSSSTWTGAGIGVAVIDSGL